MRPPKLPPEIHPALPVVTLPPVTGAVISHLSAAAIHGLPLLHEPDRPSLTLPRSRRVITPGWDRHWADLAPHDRAVTPDGFCVTAVLRTLIDCARVLPLVGAVTLMDAAMNSGRVAVEDLNARAAACRGPGSGKVQRASRLADARADSAQETVGRLALGAAGMPATPQFRLEDGPYAHPFDLGLSWARIVIDLQSRAHHAAWEKVKNDIAHLRTVNLQPGWRLIQTAPWMLLPDPEQFVRYVLGVVVTQPGARCRTLRRRYVDAEGDLIWPQIARAPRPH